MKYHPVVCLKFANVCLRHTQTQKEERHHDLLNLVNLHARNQITSFEGEEVRT